MNRRLLVVLGLVAWGSFTTARADGPLPTGSVAVSVSYMTSNGPRVISGNVDWTGQSPGDVVRLGNSDLFVVGNVNGLAKRLLAPGATRDDESMLYMGFFKPSPDYLTDWFPDIVDGGEITFEVQNIQFTEPTFLQTDTFLWHRRWDADQVDQLNQPYVNIDNFSLPTGFRDLQKFLDAGVMRQNPPNYREDALTGDYAPEFFGNGTDTMGFRITVPYAMLEHSENNGQQAPDGLPAPFGFLEPFHFHFEMAVSSVPEPGTMCLALAGMCMLRRRRDR